MSRYLSRTLFVADFTAREHRARRCYVLKTAKEVGFKEEWLRDAIAEDPEIVLAPCREAGFIRPQSEEEWKLWSTEVSIRGAGGISIDVLLVSDSGRIGIVETKLAYNPEGRREVVVQALEYAIQMPRMKMNEFPDLPGTGDGRPFVDPDVVQGRIEDGDYLLVIAGDKLDPRAVKLSNELLQRHMTYSWDLALVEVAVFQDRERPTFGLLVPHIPAGVAIMDRNVFQVRVDGKRVDVERVEGPVSMARRGPMPPLGLVLRNSHRVPSCNARNANWAMTSPISSVCT
jgi:hypothetical protein